MSKNRHLRLTLQDLRSVYKSSKKASEAKPSSYKLRMAYIEALEAYRAAEIAGPSVGSAGTMEVEAGGGSSKRQGGSRCSIL